MPKRELKEFSFRAARELQLSFRQKVAEAGIGAGSQTADNMMLPAGLVKERRSYLRRDLICALEEEMSAEGLDRQEALKKLISEAAYEVFFSLIALRFLELNGFITKDPDLFAISTTEDLQKLLASAGSFFKLDLSELKYLNELKANDAHQMIFNFLYLKKCRRLSGLFPSVFPEYPDYLELLLDFSFTDEDSLLQEFLREIPAADFDLRQKGQVEILGWFYQYYSAERRDKIISLNVRKIKEDDIATATQIFTPDWIVRYLLDNSLGRYWLEREPDSKIVDKLNFFVYPKSGKNTCQALKRVAPQDIKVLDPCVGSGHILLYAFDLLLEIYDECGYSRAEAARQILEHNLFGLDIDEKVVRLARFALFMKARSYDEKLFEEKATLNVFVLTKSDLQMKSYLAGLSLPEAEELTATYLIESFLHADEIGSLLQLESHDYVSLLAELDRLKNNSSADADDAVSEDYSDLQRLRKITGEAIMLTDSYSVVCTNPPYMNRFSGYLKSYVGEHYRDYGRDLFSVYIYRNFLFTEEGAYSALMTPYVWMFIKSYADLRRFILRHKTIVSLIQMEYSAFDAATVPLCAFILKNSPAASKGLYIKLTDFNGGLKVQEEKLRQILAAPESDYFYETDGSNFTGLPSSPIAYWARPVINDIFKKGRLMKDLVEARQGLASGDNKRFLRLWFEVDYCQINSNAGSVEDFLKSGKLYAPHNKGGAYRRWYGNYDYLIKFDQENVAALARLGNRLPSRQFYFKEAITWSLITSAGFSIRYRSAGSVPNVAGNSAFSDDPVLLRYLLALLSTPIADYLFKMMNPTLNLNVGDFDSFPVLFDQDELGDILQLSDECVQLARADWNSYELSLEFQYNPLANFPAFKASYMDLTEDREAEEKESKPEDLSEAYSCCKTFINSQFIALGKREEKLNRIFINLYNLEDELNPVPDGRAVSSTYIVDTEADVPAELCGSRFLLTKADLVRQFISYAVGCIFGRYSADQPGLAYAGGKWTAEKYQSLDVARDNIVPLTDEPYFDDDLTGRFIIFLKNIYGSAVLADNLDFIAEALKPGALDAGNTAESVIRQYLLEDFFRDHCKAYMLTGSGKRPIYWLYDSGKENAFKALIYMHRYSGKTSRLVREKYLSRQLKAYERELENLAAVSDAALSADKKRERKKRIFKLSLQLSECRKYDENLKPLAEAEIPIDLDDGVTVNYRKIQTDRDGVFYKILAAL